MQISQEINDSVPLVLTTLSNFLFATQIINTTTLNKSLTCFQSWLQYGIDIEYVNIQLIKIMIFVWMDVIITTIIIILRKKITTLMITFIINFFIEK